MLIDRIKVIHYPDGRNSNPYQSLLEKSIKHNGADIDFIKGYKSLLGLAIRPDADILHLHWVSGSLLGGNILKSLVKSMRFLLTITIIRMRGIKIFWTIHNLKNHENRQVKLELFFLRLLAKIATGLLVHGRSAIEPVVNQLKPKPDKIYVQLHGNYEGEYIPTEKREDLRKKDGIDSKTKVFLYFGKIRKYKGTPELIKAFKRVEGNVKLIIAGEPYSNELRQELELLALEDARIKLLLSFVDEERLAELLTISDVVVLPYRDILTSGSLLLAITFGKPVIAPNIGLIPEYVDESCAFLYDSEDSSGLMESLKEAAISEKIEDMGKSAKKKSGYYSWLQIGEELVRLYKNL